MDSGLFRLKPVDKTSMFTLLLVTLLFMQITIQRVNCNDLENGLIGSPEIQCNSDAIEMSFKTKKVFRGKVFVKGHYSNSDCRVDYSKTNEDGQPIGGIKLHHGQCDMDRQRMIRPEGMQFATILIISFHPLFITKIDKAFHIRCMYKETEKTVKTALDVSSLPTESLEHDFPMPVCTYSIRKDEIDGPILKYARVGDQIVHRWECQSDLYGILVHSCYVEDGQGERQLVVDDKGCHTDHILLGDPTYVESLSMAYRESLVFKFADRVVVRFQCEIRLCLKENSGCVGITPPNCFGSNGLKAKEELADQSEIFNATTSNISESNNIQWRFARSVNLSHMKPTFDTDLISQSVYVLDSEEEASETDRSANGALFRIHETQDVCVSATVFILFLSILTIVFVIITAISLSIMLNWISTTTKGQKINPKRSFTFAKDFFGTKF